MKLHQNIINLRFRQAWLEYKKEQSGEVFERALRDLKKRFGDDWTKEDQTYFDILFEVNYRGKSLEDIMQKESTIDPEKEAFIKNQIEGKGVLSKKKLYFYR